MQVQRKQKRKKKIVYGIFQKKKKREETIKFSYADNFFLCPSSKTETANYAFNENLSKGMDISLSRYK